MKGKHHEKPAQRPELVSSIDISPFRKFSLSFRLLEGLVFAPLTAMVGQMLRGNVVVDSTAIINFVLSPRGFAAVIISAAIFLTVRFMENAGLSVLVAGQAMGARPTAKSAFKHIIAKSSALARATLLILGAGLGLLAPLTLLAGFLAHRLLSLHDINYYLHAKPPEFVGAAVALGVVGLATVAIGVWCALRWRWVAQVLMFESEDVLAAFHRSAVLARPVWLSIAGWWIVVGLINLVLGTAGAWVGRLFLPLVLEILGEGIRSMGFVLGGLLVMQALVGALFTLFGAVMEAQIFTRFYLRRSGRTIDVSKLSSKALRRPKRWWVSPSVMLGLVIVGGVLGSIWGGEALLTERPMLVIAHRASVNDAPENTVPAVLQAIQDGADVAEIDVQLSRDNVLVVAHDSDFARVAGVAKRISEMTWEEIRKIDIGSSFSPKFQGTRPARLEEILAAARGRIRLNIELKHYGAVDGKLEEKVVQVLEQNNMVDEIEIQSLEFEALEIVRGYNPDIVIGYLLSVNARQPEKLKVDFLSVQMSRVNARFLRRARRQGLKVYVWTVDDEKQMEKSLALGVDGLITNRSSRAAEFVKEWASLSPNEKALRRLRFWLAG